MGIFAPSKNVLALLLAASGFILIVSSLRGVVGISADSITYTSVARNLNAHGSLNAFDGDAFVDFPLGYPLLLGAIQFMTRTDPFVFGLWLNGLLFAMLIYVLVCLLKEEGLDKTKSVLAGACMVLSPALLVVYEMLWSETFFILCQGVFMAAAFHYGRTHKRTALGAMAVGAALACVTRYAGLTLVATGGLAILGDKGTKKRWGKAMLFGAVSISLLGANLIRNRLISGTLTGDRQKNYLSLSTHLHRLGGVLTEWLPPLHDFPSTYVLVATLFIITLVGILAWFRIIKKDSLSLFSISALFCLLYTLFILSTAMLTKYEGLDVRLLSPLYIPAFLGILGWVHHKGINPRVVVIGLAILAVANAFLDVRYIKHPEIAFKRYFRYDMATLKHSPTLEFINSHPQLFGPDTGTYSNAPDLMYIFSPGYHADYLPELNNPRDVKDFQEDHGARLIWLNACLAYPQSYLISLEKNAEIKKEYTFPDGAVYIHP